MENQKTTIQLPATNPASPLSSFKGAHVAMRVPDYEAAKKWFIEKLDFRLVHEWPFGDLQLAYLAPANDNNFWVELLAGGEPKQQPNYSDLNESLHQAGYHHFCINVDSVDKAVEELKKRGVTIVGESFNLPVIGRRLAFFSDPWGNLIELSEQIS